MPPLRLLPLVAVLLVFCGACGGSTASGTETPTEEALPTLAAPTRTPAPGTPTSSALTTAPATLPARATTPTAAPTPKQVVVAHTEGQGVYLHGSKQLADRLQAYAEGTVLDVRGPAEDGEGGQWLPVRAPDGTEGWVLAQYTEPK